MLTKIYNNQNLLHDIDQEFIKFLAKHQPQICDQLMAYRLKTRLPKSEYSEFIISLAPYLEDFIADKFQITQENNTLKTNSNAENIIFEARRKFAERYALKHYSPDEFSTRDIQDISTKLKSLIGELTQKNIAQNCLKWLEDKTRYSNEIDIAAQYCSQMVGMNSSLALFDIPRKINADNHIRQYRISQLEDKVKVGFDFRDCESQIDFAQTHANYCLYCHKQNKDSCSVGFTKEQDGSEGGCPLDQKISEMNLLRSQGYNIAALAVITIDNPLVALTGHRICNDCAKACIFQKQTPVNIPVIETNILESVLSLPYGVEIYYLLSQWNPLKLASYLPEANTNHSILVAGLGPAGIAASYYFCRQGYQVFAIDGLKILKCDLDINKPIKYWQDIISDLSERVSQGFGGVAEYGITNRWNKNFLLLARIILERNSNFNYQGSVRLGSNLTISQAFDYGFDHIALCLGAGKPKYLPDAGYFLKGVKSSADFLMQLQQASAYNKDSTSNLQIRLPAYVYGGGLTAIDSAVELLNYYPSMVKNFANKYNAESAKNLSLEERQLAEEYLQHAEIFSTCSNPREIINAIGQLGGVNVIYRKKLQDSPAYARNHEEIEHAIATGINFIEERSIVTALPDEFGNINSITLSDGTNLSAGTLLLGLGTGQCDFTDISDKFDANNDFFKSSDHKISYFGDCNPAYHGSVVKAISSVKDGYQLVSQAIMAKKPSGLKEERFKHDLNSVIVENQPISGQITKLTISSPLAVKNFKIGQFFRLQNLESDIDRIMEPLVISPYKINRVKGEVSFLIRNIGKSSSIACTLKSGQQVALMGPAGNSIDTHLAIKENNTIMLLCKNIGTAIALPLLEELAKKTQNKIHLITDVTDEIYDILSLDSLGENYSNIAVTRVAKDQSIKDLLRSMKVSNELQNIRFIFNYGSDNFEQQAQEYISKYFSKNVQSISMINVPMQCLMKGICGQCIQKVNDDRGYIFVCDKNAQNTKDINFSSLKQRHKMNSLLEKVL